MTTSTSTCAPLGTLEFEATGFSILPPLVAPALLDELCEVLALAPPASTSAGRGVYARRDVLEIAPVREVCDIALLPLAQQVLGPGARPVRGLLFDKIPGANWKVPWHQDLSIAVREKVEAVGFGPWSEKEGVPHVQPPAAVLEAMLALRLHLDACPPENGPLRVLPGSHRGGRLGAAQITWWRAQVLEECCAVERGGVLAMRPLLLHASSASAAPAHRRVLHIEWAARDLPAPLRWFYGGDYRDDFGARLEDHNC